MMAKENSEKTNLLPSDQEKNEDKKRKQYIVSRSQQARKSGRDKSPGDDDTCSCVSCALKRIVGSECVCIICLLLLFLISIVVACILVFKSGSTLFADSTEIPQMSKIHYNGQSGDSERLKRKIDLITEDPMKSRLKEEGIFRDFHYDDNVIKPGLVDIPLSSELDFAQGISKYNNVGDNGDMELTNFLGPDKLGLQGNDRLREFYKKLVETDAEIKSLKKSRSHEKFLYNTYETKSPNRSRRSLKLYDFPKTYHVLRHRRDSFNKITNGIHQPLMHIRRPKRFVNETDDATGFVLENKRLIVQYKPAVKKKVPKCSHTPKQPNDPQHEHQLKHPFYQNSQRLDELLDRFFNRNLPDFMADNSWETLFQAHKNKCKHPKFQDNKSVIIDGKYKKENFTRKEYLPIITHFGNTGEEISNHNSFKMTNDDNKSHQKEKPLSNPLHKMNEKTSLVHTSDIENIFLSESTTIFDPKFYHQDAKLDKQNPLTGNINDLDLFFTVLAKSNSETSQTMKPVTTYSLMDSVPQIRRLMQADGEEEENLGYEDLKEVLTDDMENQDDVDSRRDRNKRNQKINHNVACDDTVTPTTSLIENFPQRAQMSPLTKVIKLNPPSVHNPNWKGPMPLYPDELNSMLQDITTNFNKASQHPLIYNKDLNDIYKKRKTKDNSEMEYVEHYLDNSYDNLAQTAQAYSDYGVLDEKKENGNVEKNQATENISSRHTAKSLGSREFLRRGALKRQTIIGEQNELRVDSRVHHKNPIQPSSDGIRIEIRPTTAARADNFDIKKFLNSHFKIAKHIVFETDPINPKRLFTPVIEQANKQEEPANDDEYTSSNLLFAINKGRSLLSTQTKRSDQIIGDDILEDNHEDIIVAPVKNNNEGYYEMPISETRNYLKHTIYYENNNQNIKNNCKKDSINNKIPTVINSTLDVNILPVTLNSKALHKLVAINEGANFFNDSLNKQSTITPEHNANESNSSLCKIVSSWFQTPEEVKIGINRTGTNISLDILELLTPGDNSSNNSKQDNINTITGREHPQYDEIETHRSRVLMSINEDKTNDSEDNSKKQYTEVTIVMNKNVSESNSTSTTASNVKQNRKNNTISEIEQSLSNLQVRHEQKSRKVKRNADDSNLIFWSDIYDDEYGVQTDNLDGVITDRYSKKHSDFIKRSGKWMQDKIMKLSENLKGHESEVNGKNRAPRAAARCPKSINDYDPDQKAVFKALKSNLGQVCKEAAAAVKRIRNTDVKEGQHSTRATSLMQQLVGVLTELINHQVQQKSCTVLPPDLRRFLDWLTLPQSATVRERESVSVGTDPTISYIENYWNVADDTNPRESYKKFKSMLSNDLINVHKTSYRDTLHSVQDLLRQYELMNDDDKSKMTGIKYYLQNQMRYLKNELGSNPYDVYDKNSQYFRYKRHGYSNDYRKPKRRFKRTLHKFIKYFGKKHTRTTAGYYDGIVVTEKKKNKAEPFEISEEKHPQKNLQDDVSKDVKRNLKDVYYQAVAEAKKYTKQGLKKEDTAEFRTTQNVKFLDMSRLSTEKSTTVRLS